MFVANFLSVIFTYKNQKPEQDDTSEFATPATLKAPVLSTLFEITRWSIHCYGPTMATLLYNFRYRHVILEILPLHLTPFQ